MNSDREELEKANLVESDIDIADAYEGENKNANEIENESIDDFDNENINKADNLEDNTQTEKTDKEKIDENKEIDIEKLLQDIQNSINLNKTLVENGLNINIKTGKNSKKNSKTSNDTTADTTTTASDASTCVPMSETLAKTLATLTTVNGIKEQVCLLPLDFCMRNYFNNAVLPLVSTLDLISRLSFNLSASVGVLTNSPIVPVRRSDVKDTIELIYCVNAQCADIYAVACKRINTLISYARCNKL